MERRVRDSTGRSSRAPFRTCRRFTPRRLSAPPPAMSAAVHIFESPLGVVRSLGARVWYVLPGCAGVLAAYSYFPKPTLPGEPGGQNLAGACGAAPARVDRTRHGVAH